MHGVHRNFFVKEVHETECVLCQARVCEQTNESKMWAVLRLKMKDHLIQLPDRKWKARILQIPIYIIYMRGKYDKNAFAKGQKFMFGNINSLQNRINI